MNFLAPLAFALAALLPVIVALYFLKLRRTEQRVASTYLWRTLVRDTAANAPWQKLKPNWLLLLQLLFLAALIFALARPFTWSDVAAGSHLIVVLDTSPSMSATDVGPTRLAEAIATAQRLVASLPSSSRVTLIEAGQSLATNYPLPITHFSSMSSANLASALTLAAAIAAREPDSEVVILSDGHVNLPQPITLPTRVRFISIGNASDNQAIGAFSAQREASGRNLTAFVQLVNYGAQAAQRRLSLYADGRLFTARDVALLPGQAQALTFPGLPSDARTLEARLDGADLLALDDRAWAVPPAGEKISVPIVSNGNRFLETVFRLMPNVEITTTKPLSNSQIPNPNLQPPTSSLQLPTSNNQLPITNYQLTIFDAFVPTGTLPSGNLLFIAPPRATELFSVTGALELPLPVPVVADDAVLRFVDLRDVSVQSAARIPLPSWARAVIMDNKTNAPLLIVGEQGGRRLAVLAFDLRQSDLPLRVAFPLLMANLLDALVPSSALGTPTSIEPGRPVVIPAPPQTNEVMVRLPDGQTQRILRQAQDAAAQDGRIIFAQTKQLGIYEVRWQGRDATPTRFNFAVNLFNADESDITPRETIAVTSAQSVGNAQELPRARDEWWRPLAWLALALLVGEWLFAHRGQLARVWEWGRGRGA